MSQQQHYNSATAIGWVLLIVMIVIAVIFVGELIHDGYKKYRTHKNDNSIFKAAEEARSDFS
jgi:cell division protein FtsL